MTGSYRTGASKAHAGEGIHWASRARLIQRQGTLVERCSLSVLVLGFVHHCQVIQRCGQSGVLWANGLLKEF